MIAALYKETITFKCSEGFYLRGNPNRTCTRNGTLQPPYPNCTVIACQRPRLSSELHISSNPFRQKFYFNESISFFCSVGFNLLGTSVRYCTKIDDFQNDLPTCSNTTCQRPILKTASVLRLSTNTLQQTFSYNESISFVCTEGYILQGPTIKYCQKNEDFQHNLPTCTVQEVKSTQIPLTVAFLSGGAIGVVLISSVFIVFVLIRRRRSLQKRNVAYEGRIQRSDDKDHEYAGIEHQSNLSSDNFTRVYSVSENISPHNMVRDGHYEETSTSPDDNDHEYTELKMIQMNLPRETTKISQVIRRKFSA